MLTRVRTRTATYNNAPAVASSLLLSLLKLVYYNAFAILYGVVGLWAHTVVVNSQWTEAHVKAIWWRLRRSAATVVYPPCDTEALQELPLLRPLKTSFLVSVAQFRPEKNQRCASSILCSLLARRKDACDCSSAAVRTEAAMVHCMVVVQAGHALYTGWSDHQL